MALCILLPTSLLAFLLVLQPCSCFSPNVFLNHSSFVSPSGWQPARATWYGARDGAGSVGGACGYGDAVHNPPFNSMVSAGNNNLFTGGKGCGACYQVKCTENPLCSGNPVTVTITDQCPGGPCAAEAVHFDLSGTAFGALALPGKADQLLSAGTIAVEFSRFPCHYEGYTIAFKVDGGSTAYYFAVLVEFEGGDGDLSAVELKQLGGSQDWLPMEQSWGATWKLNSGSPLSPPFSIRLTTLASHAVVVADDVIPVGWKAGATYISHVS